MLPRSFVSSHSFASKNLLILQNTVLLKAGAFMSHRHISRSVYGTFKKTIRVAGIYTDNGQDRKDVKMPYVLGNGSY